MTLLQKALENIYMYLKRVCHHSYKSWVYVCSNESVYSCISYDIYRKRHTASKKISELYDIWHLNLNLNLNFRMISSFLYTPAICRKVSTFFRFYITQKQGLYQWWIIYTWSSYLPNSKSNQFWSYILMKMYLNQIWEFLIITFQVITVHYVKFLMHKRTDNLICFRSQVIWPRNTWLYFLNWQNLPSGVAIVTWSWECGSCYDPSAASCHGRWSQIWASQSFPSCHLHQYSVGRK